MLKGDARSLHRAGERWRVETDEGRSTAPEAIVALGPWARDLLDPMGLKLPLAVKRGYHRHFRAQGNAGLTRPVLDGSVGYVITPMEQGIRMTTGVEFAARDAPPTPVQFDRIMPKACELFPLGERADDKTWLGRRPCLSGFTAGDRPRAGQAWAVVGDWPCPLGADAWAFDRASARRHDHRRRPLRRSSPIPGGAVSLAELVVPARQRVGERQRGRLVDAAGNRARQHVSREHAERAQREHRIG